MFRFSIGELMLGTLVVAMGISWLADRRQLCGSLDRAAESLNESKERQAELNQLCKFHREALERVEKQLPRYGLHIWWAHSTPVVTDNSQVSSQK
jgi:hypothetical protein